MKILGYTDRLSVQPGESIKFMVSCQSSTYRADIVRLIHGDPNPQGPGFKEELVQTPVSGDYPGHEQPVRIGSYVIVPDSPLLRGTGGFTLQAWIYPTTPKKGVQGLLTKWSDLEDKGYGLFIDEGGELELWLGGAGGHIYRLATGRPLGMSTWYFVAATYDPESRKALLYQEPVKLWPSEDTEALAEAPVGADRITDTEAPLLMGGYLERIDSPKPLVAGHYNGKIDAPRLFGRALGLDEIMALKRGASPLTFGSDLIATWDFSEEISSTRVIDLSTHLQHGRTANMPARGMTGHNWTGNETDFKQRLEEYGAIHFHDDDLDDADWEEDFELKVPPQMKSGVYAARLTAGDDREHVPFFVRPPRGISTADVAFLVPTFSYLAYANNNVDPDPNNPFSSNLVEDFEYPVREQDKYIVEQRLVSLYDHHSDGSGVCYSTRLRPLPSMRPGYNLATLARGRGSPHQLSADLHLLDWLEAKDHEYDVITDEDLHWDGADLLAPYRVIVTGSHPEYWSAQMLDALEVYLRNGGRMMYMGGNGFYWVTCLDPEARHTIEVRRWGGTQAWNAAPGERYHSTTGELGGLWRNRGRAPQKLVGIGFTSQGNDRNAPYHRQPGSRDPRAAFIFEGIGDEGPIGDFPSLVMEHGAAGFELDRIDYSLGTPSHTILLATATDFSDAYQHVVEEINESDSRQGGTVNELVKADLVYLQYPRGGGVFSVGSICWCGSLSYNNYDNNVSLITYNVLRRFSSPEPLS